MTDEKTFADYKNESENWITLSTGEFYPDILPDACLLYSPVLANFGRLIRESHSSANLYISIMETKNTWMRTQLCRVFKKYVSPATSVELIKRKSKITQVLNGFEHQFRNIAEVQKQFDSRPIPDETLCAILWEYKDRGKRGYDLTERLFEILRGQFAEMTIKGPERAGRDVPAGSIFEDYPRPNRPIDFVVYEGKSVLAIGLARYDTDRGGAQEDDRTGLFC